MNAYNKILSTLNTSSQIADGEVPAVYFLGIGGIGMSALARYFKSLGVVVSGYDKTATVLTKLLAAEGINIHYEDNIELVDKHPQIVIYTPAVPKDHKEYNYFLQNNFTVVKRSVLNEMPRTTAVLLINGFSYRWILIRAVQPIAFRVSCNLTLQSESNWSLFNGMWQKKT